MASVTAADFAKNFGRYREMVQREPVAITSHGRETCYLISAEEYRRLKKRDRDVFDVSDMPDDVIETIRTTRMDPRHDHLDALLED